MLRRFRSPSLFVTLATAFLVVLILAVILEVLVVVGVVYPLIDRWERDRAELLAEDAARRIAALGDEATSDQKQVVLRDYLTPERGLMLMFLGSDGEILMPFPGHRPGRFRSPDGERRLARRRPPPPWAEFLDLEGTRPREGGGRFPRAPLARVDVSDGSGQVLAFGRPRRLQDLGEGASWALVAFLPVAIALAAGAGLLIFRNLVRRLGALEALAQRVSRGDLAARVPEPGPDEIGRVGASLNRMTESLQQAHDLVQAAQHQRQRLLADISHELNTPLTSIRGYTETLLNPDVQLSGQERGQYLESMLEEASRLDALIQDLLELSRLEAGAGTLEPVELDWAQLCANTVQRFEPRFAAAGLWLTWGGASGDTRVQADGRRMEQVLENLLGNALRYVPAGGHVRCGLSAEEAPVLWVEDNGPGIPPEDLPHVFDRFYRADASRATEGTGLGLAIVREIVERHGGQVRALNLDSGGARFEVQLPRG